MSARHTRTERATAAQPRADYLDATREFWQPYADRPLSREDAREMAHNLLGFFTVLREWTIRERELSRSGITPPPPAPRKLRKSAASNKIRS